MYLSVTIEVWSHSTLEILYTFCWLELFIRMLRSTRQVSETYESGVYLNRMIHQWYPAQYGGQSW